MYLFTFATVMLDMYAYGPTVLNNIIYITYFVIQVNVYTVVLNVYTIYNYISSMHDKMKNEI